MVIQVKLDLLENIYYPDPDQCQLFISYLWFELGTPSDRPSPAKVAAVENAIPS